MDFSTNNKIVKLCLQGMQLEEKGETVEAGKLFLQAWHESTNDFEQFLAAHYVARQQVNLPDRLKWLETALQLAQKTDIKLVKSAFPSLHKHIAGCYQELSDLENATKHHQLAESLTEDPSDDGPFYHGTKADLGVGELLTAGYGSNYKEELIMNHIYFTGMVNGAGLAASLAKGNGEERVYIVEPQGTFENDPNVTNKKFPGNPTRSYRTESPLRIIGEVKDWRRQTQADLQHWRERLANNKGEIIN